MEPGYVVSENEGARVKLVRDPDLPLDVPEGVAVVDLIQRVLRINRVLVGEAPLGDVLAAILDTLLDLTRGTAAHLLTLGEDGEPREEARRPSGTAEGASMSIVGEVLRTGRAVLVYDASSDSRFGAARSVVGSGLRSVLCVPLRVDGAPRGALHVANRSAPGMLTANDLFLIEAFADQAALAVETARLQARNRELTARLSAQLVERTEELAEAREQLDRVEEDHRLRYRYDRIVHTSEGMRRVLDIVDRVTDSDLPVLVIGESGTGKELVARAVHYNGPRRGRPFVAVNCGAVASSVFESEFFGHVRGAFTGADRARKGHFEAASGGTLFLDEVGELELAMQVKLLRVLQEGEVLPVGSSTPVPVDVRVVAATNKPLDRMVADGTFRQDLFYRIGVVRIDVPPLRERRADIPALVERFVSDLAERRGARPFAVPASVLEALRAYDWPGNIRELENAVGYMSIFAESGLENAPLPFLRGTRSAAPTQPPAPHTGGLTLPAGTSLATAEKALIEHTLDLVEGSRTRASELLGIDRATLYRKLKSW